MTSGSTHIACLDEILAAPVQRLDDMGGAGRDKARELHHPTRQAERLFALFALHRGGQGEL